MAAPLPYLFLFGPQSTHMRNSRGHWKRATHAKVRVQPSPGTSGPRQRAMVPKTSPSEHRQAFLLHCFPCVPVLRRRTCCVGDGGQCTFSSIWCVNAWAGQDAVWLAAVHVDASRYAVVGATNNKLKLTYPATSIRSRLVRTELLEAGIRHLILIAKEARQELQ